jgi:hypothetical protein
MNLYKGVVLKKWQLINIDLTLPNPFIPLANSGAPCQNAHVGYMLLYEKLIKCEKHNLIAWHLNAYNNQNIWLVLVALHQVFISIFSNLPEVWISFLQFLTTFQPKNKKALHSAVYGILCNLREVLETDYGKKEYIYYPWVTNDEEIYQQFNDIVNILVLNNTHHCICNSDINYDIDILKLVKKTWPKIPLNLINTRLNNIPINHSLPLQLFKYICTIDNEFTNPIDVIAVDCNCHYINYDVLPQQQRLDYILHMIENKYIQKVFYDLQFNKLDNDAETQYIHITDHVPSIYVVSRSKNTCFVCDAEFIEIYNQVKVKREVIVEYPSNYKPTIIYPITHRCHHCKNGKYGRCFSDNTMLIEARNYKWTTFYTGLSDTQSLLYHVPKEIMWVIIILYTYSR